MAGIFGACIANAQIQLDSTDFALPGDTIINGVDSLDDTIDLTLTGNQSWDFSNAALHYFDTTVFADTVGAPSSSEFPLANVTSWNRGVASFNEFDSTQIVNHGLAGDINFDIAGIPVSLSEVKFDPPMTLMQFPADYLDIFYDTAISDVTTAVSLGGLYDSLRVINTIHCVSEMDAYGSLVTPGGTFTNTLRQKYSQYSIADVKGYNAFLGWSDVDVSVFGLDPSILIDSSIVYRWYAKGEKFAVAEAGQDSVGSVSAYFAYKLTGQLLGLAESVTEADCGTLCNGSVLAVPMMGTAPYNYVWNDVNGQTTALAIGLCAGTYTCTITDFVLDSYSTSATIGQNTTAWSATIASTDATCMACTDGTATASAAGTSPYTYQWSTGATTVMASNLPVGNVQVTVTDANGCTDVASGAVAGVNSISKLNVENVVKFYPNPADKQISIETYGSKLEEVRVFNLVGAQVLQTNTSRINVGALQNGLYLLRFKVGDKVITKRLEIIH